MFDKSDEEPHATLAQMVAGAVPTMADTDPVIAHNKDMVIDQNDPSPTVITGLFNYTVSAQRRNAENLLVMTGDPALAKDYAENFAFRWKTSQHYQLQQRRSHYADANE